MPEQRLHGGDRHGRAGQVVGRRVEQRRGERVAQVVRREGGVELGGLPQRRHDLADTTLAQWAALAQEEPAIGPCRPRWRRLVPGHGCACLAIGQGAPVFQVVLQRLARLQHQGYLPMLESFAAPDHQQPPSRGEAHVGQRERRDLAHARAGEAHQAHQRERQAVVTGRARGRRATDRVPVGARESLRWPLHDGDAVHLAHRIVGGPTGGGEEKSEADQGAIDGRGGAAGGEEGVAVVTHVLGRHLSWRPREAAALEPDDKGRGVARILGDARGGEPCRPRHLALPGRQCVPHLIRLSVSAPVRLGVQYSIGYHIPTGPLRRSSGAEPDR